MKRNFYFISFAALFFMTIIFGLINGFNGIGIINSLFMAALLLFCISLFILLLSQGAFSIMGHSFRRFQYMTAPKRMRKTMEDDELYSKKQVDIRQQHYPITMPLLYVSSAAMIITLIISFMQS